MLVGKDHKGSYTKFSSKFKLTAQAKKATRLRRLWGSWWTPSWPGASNMPSWPTTSWATLCKELLLVCERDQERWGYLAPRCPVIEQGEWTEIKEFHLKFWKISLLWGRSNNREKLSVLEAIQKLTGLSWAICSGWPCLFRGVGPEDLRRSLPASKILWFCDSIIWIPSYKREKALSLSAVVFFPLAS